MDTGAGASHLQHQDQKEDYRDRDERRDYRNDNDPYSESLAHRRGGRGTYPQDTDTNTDPYSANLAANDWRRRNSPQNNRPALPDTNSYFGGNRRGDDDNWRIRERSPSSQQINEHYDEDYQYPQQNNRNQQQQDRYSHGNDEPKMSRYRADLMR